MKQRIAVLIVALLVIGAVSSASTYCSDIFGNVNQIVSPSLYNNTSFTSVIALSFLIVMMVLISLALVYAIGYGFGINKLVAFVKSEYLESIFNILLIFLIAGGAVSFSAISGLFTNTFLIQSSQSSTSQSITTSLPVPTSMLAMYTDLCNNIITNQVAPGFHYYVDAGLESLVLSFLSGIENRITISGTYFEVVTLPTFVFKPFVGLNIISGLVGLETAATVTFMALNIGLIFLLFAIYFLFPVFMYLGILFRSFIWTRAAGGTLLSLFIAFYIVFPSVMYPISALPNLLNSVSSTSTGLPYITSSTDMSAYLQNVFTNVYNSASGLQLIFNPINTNINGYSLIITYFAILMIGTFIAFLISYDLSQILARILGAPSLNVGRAMGRLI